MIPENISNDRVSNLLIIRSVFQNMPVIVLIERRIDSLESQEVLVICHRIFPVGGQNSKTGNRNEYTDDQETKNPIRNFSRCDGRTNIECILYRTNGDASKATRTLVTPNPLCRMYRNIRRTCFRAEFAIDTCDLISCNLERTEPAQHSE